MAGPGPAAVVVAPPLAPPRIGLIASSRAASALLDATDPAQQPPEGIISGNAAGADRWENGYQYAPENVSADTGVSDPCQQQVLSQQPNLPIVHVDPFVIWASDACSPFDLSRDWVGRATRLLIASQEKRLAHEFWTGTQAAASGWQSPYLANTNATTLGTGMGVVDSLACLEQALMHCGAGVRGMIHAPADLVTQWAAYKLLNYSVVGNSVLVTTYNDTIVVASPGYTGSGPSGQAPTTGAVWAYATGLVSVRLGPIDLYPLPFATDDIAARQRAFAFATDRAQNTVEFFAARHAAADWDTYCHFACSVNINWCSGIGS